MNRRTGPRPPHFVFMGGMPPPGFEAAVPANVIEMAECPTCHVHCAPSEFVAESKECSVCRGKKTEEAK